MEIKFRGLRTDGKGWVYGSFVPSPKSNSCSIGNFVVCDYLDASHHESGVYYQLRSHSVIPETVGQYLFTHPDGTDIYNGDIMTQIFQGIKYDYEILFDPTYFGICRKLIDANVPEWNKRPEPLIYMYLEIQKGNWSITGTIHDHLIKPK